MINKRIFDLVVFYFFLGQRSIVRKAAPGTILSIVLLIELVDLKKKKK